MDVWTSLLFVPIICNVSGTGGVLALSGGSINISDISI